MIRFSDVLLMFAEAENEINNGPTAAAISAFEEVRKRGYRGNVDKIGTTPTDKAGFFNAIVNERYLEFGTEAIRKYDLIRWNLLATKLAETRTKIQQIRDRVPPYNFVPQYVYYKNTGEELTFYTSWDSTSARPFWKPTQVPPEGTIGSAPTAGTRITRWVRVDWTQHLTANLIDGLPLHQAIARFFTPNKSELYPFDQATMDAYQGRLTQNPNY
ncbi:MAG: RagB/SusD family nutrient uptake outer membrane protein [Bacteroidota bacterium]|nr:RagB/SusD family nutrient uptake outer membrane protein [Bacteroidota bacterium]